MKRSLRLYDEYWAESDVHSAIWAIMRAEYLGKGDTFDGHKYVQNGDMSSEHKWQRLRLFYNQYRRRFLWGEIPPDTRWFKIENLRDRHLKELKAISHCDLDGAGGMMITKGYKKIGWNLRDDQELWDCPVLFGNSDKGPFTIIEGNHRLLGWRKKHPRGNGRLRVPVYIGLSSLPCYWHDNDRGGMVLTNDLWLKRSRK